MLARYRTRSAGLDAARSRALVREVDREVARTGRGRGAAAAALGLGAEEARLLEHATTNTLPKLPGRCRLTYATTRAGKLLADRALSQVLKSDWPKTIDELERKRGSP